MAISDPTVSSLAAWSQQQLEQLQLHSGAWGAALLGFAQSIDAPFGVKEVVSGRYVEANEAFLSLVGLSREAVVGKHDSDLFGVEQGSALRAADQLALQSNTAQAA